MRAKKKNSKQPRKLEKPAREAPKPALTKTREDRPAFFPVVGLGASAGGLEAFEELLKLLPCDMGMAYVLIQHLSPDYQSMLTEILSRATQMQVHEAKDGMPLEPDHVYVIPPDSNLSLVNGMLYLMARTEPRGQHMPIDYFFSSLAQDRRGAAIGIVLSGTASDGTVGLKAIKAEGGVTIAQDPKTAKYDGMPRNAIAAGVVDFVLTFKQMVAELERIREHPFLRLHKPAPGSEPFPEEHEALAKIFALLRNATGVDFSGYKDTTIKRRIKRRMVLHKFDSPKNYVRYLQENRSEISQLFEDILINVTGFFRDPETFEALKRSVFPEIVKTNSPGNTVRIWVPGCSTGQEAYSIAIALIEFLGDTANSIPIQIFATDIDEQAIEIARAGFYPENISTEVSPERLRRFFTMSDNGFRISKTIRDSCVFAKQDVTRDPPFSRIDLISCRNLMIYLGSALQKRVLTIFHYALKVPGFLMLGSSESIGDFAGLFSQTDLKHKIYMRKSSASQVQSHFLATDYGMSRAEHLKKATEHAKLIPDTRTEVDRLLLNRYAPAGVVINEHLEILQFRGHTGTYLEPAPGDASLNLLNMARNGLMLELRSLVQSAIARRVPVRKERVQFKVEGRQRLTNVEIAPLSPHAGEALFLVLFEEIPLEKERPEKNASQRKPKTKAASEASEVERLKQELAAVREYLQTVIRESEATNQDLQSANEEIVSSNEELQSTNEELETAKEELQATNEELTTVNEELQNRNIELTRSNNDQINLLSSVNIPILMLGIDLRIRRFTPMAEKLLNLIPSDIGRPITDMKLKIEIPRLEQMISEVIETMSVHEEHVLDKDGRIYSIRIRPYKTTENHIDGVVVALIEVGEARRAAEGIQKLRAESEALMEFISAPLLVLDSDLRVLSVNSAFCQEYSGEPGAFETRLLKEAQDGRWDRPAIHEVIKKARSAPGRTVTIEEKDQYRIVALCTPSRQGRPQLLLMAFYPMHE